MFLEKNHNVEDILEQDSSALALGYLRRVCDVGIWRIEDVRIPLVNGRLKLSF